MGKQLRMFIVLQFGSANQKSQFCYVITLIYICIQFVIVYKTTLDFFVQINKPYYTCLNKPTNRKRRLPEVFLEVGH